MTNGLIWERSEVMLWQRLASRETGSQQKASALKIELASRSKAGDRIEVVSLNDERIREEELLRQTVAGDDLAARRLLLPHLAQLTRVIGDKYPKLNHGIASVDDVIQETFTEAYRQIQQFDPEKGSLRTWLATIADRRAKRAVRDARRVKRGGDHKQVGQLVGDESSYHNLVEILSAGNHTASRSAMRHEAVQALHAAIADLPEDYQRAVQLHLIDGKTLRETAVIMNRTLKSVEGLIVRAKNKMRDALGRLSRYQ